MNFEDILKVVVDNGISVALLFYFIWKDSRFTETIAKSLQAIQDSLEILKDNVAKKDD